MANTKNAKKKKQQTETRKLPKSCTISDSYSPVLLRTSQYRFLVNMAL